MARWPRSQLAVPRAQRRDPEHTRRLVTLQQQLRQLAQVVGCPQKPEQALRHGRFGTLISILKFSCRADILAGCII